MEQNVLERILEGSMNPTDLPFETLRKITDGFSADRIIGEGGFGMVYKGIIGNRSVAVKRIRSSKTIDLKYFHREVNSLMEINHPNVVRFLGLCSHTVETPMKNPKSRGYIFAEKRERLLCFEYVSNGSLDTQITDELRGLEWDQRYKIIRGICEGLHYLHIEKRILHMDLKPANILLDDHMVPKITDFGLSRPTENSQTMTTNHFASRGYCAPENLDGGRMTEKSDMYSLGVIVIELVTGHKGTPDSNNILRRWRHRWNKSAKETPSEYQQQITKCIEIGLLCKMEDPCARPYISAVMSKFAEIESMDNHSTNASKPTVGQINLPTWEDDMLEVEPLELQFGYDKQKQILSSLVELSNDTDGFIFFEIQKMSPLPYSIKPKIDIVKPRSKYRVDITLPVANMQALQYSTSSKRYTKEFIVRSIKVNKDLTTEDINKDMFDKHKEGHHVDEVHLAVISEEPCSEEAIDLPSEETKKEHASSSSGTRPMPSKPGSAQLVIKNNKKAPLLEYEKRVILELTGGDYTSDRPGLDLVVVLDVGIGMRNKMDRLKTAMRFVVQKLGPIDRLSIITFSYAAKKLCPLSQITESSQQKLQELIGGLMDYGRASNMKAGLLTGLKVLADRKVSDGRVAAIMLMSDGKQSKGDATQVTVGNVPVYTFGFGASSDPRVLNAIAAKSMGGTFSDVQDTAGGGLTMAFSQCLAGLLTVAVQNLELTVAAVGDESAIVKAAAGSYTQMNDAAGSVTVRFGNLYSWEVRNVVVDLLLPTIDSERSAEILKVSYSYTSRKLQFVAPPETLTVWRTGVEVSEEELQMEEVRLRTAKMIKEARTMLYHKHYWFTVEDEVKAAQKKLVQAQNMLVEQCDPLLRNELLELLELFKNTNTCDEHGHAYALSSESSHGRQRFAARGRDMEIMRFFATPLMDMYLGQAKKFHDDPTIPLPSADDDLEEDVGALRINVARKKEMRRLRMDTGAGFFGSCDGDEKALSAPTTVPSRFGQSFLMRISHFFQHELNTWWAKLFECFR